jgi:hypothetical protein
MERGLVLVGMVTRQVREKEMAAAATAHSKVTQQQQQGQGEGRKSCKLLLCSHSGSMAGG